MGRTEPATLRLQIKSDPTLVVRTSPAPFAWARTAMGAALSMNGRAIPIEVDGGVADETIERIARAAARVLSALPQVLQRVRIKGQPNASDASWSERYGLPVRAAMGAVASGRVNIYPEGIEYLRSTDPDLFTRGRMHELGHCWSLRHSAEDPTAAHRWLAAIAADRSAPSQYALLSFRNSGLPYEDVAEATALYFLVVGTDAFSARQAAMPARFALLDARFGV